MPTHACRRRPPSADAGARIRAQAGCEPSPVLFEPGHTSAKGARVLDADPPESACAVGQNRCNDSDRNRRNCSCFPPTGSQERYK